MNYLRRIYGLIRQIIQVCFQLFDDARIARQVPLMARFYQDVFSGTADTAGLPVEAQHMQQALQRIGELPSLPPLGQPTLTVVIPHYNQWEYLREALAALGEQSVLPDEIVVVDDQSDPKNLDRLHQIIAESNQRVKTLLFIAPEKFYVGRARQFGAEAASGDIILMHDADDVSHRQRVELTKKVFVEFPDTYQFNIGFIEFKRHYYEVLRPFAWSEAQQRLKTPAQIKDRMADVFKQQLFSTVKRSGIRFGDYSIGDFEASGGHVAYRRELVPLVKWRSTFNPYFTKYEDYDFNVILFLALKGQKSLSLDLPLFYYRKGSTTNTVHY